MIDFKSYKRKSSTSNLSKLTEEKSGYTDERIWKYSRSKNSKDIEFTNATIRFLGISKADYTKAEEKNIDQDSLTSIVRVLKYNFQTESGVWFNDIAPATFGDKKDPVSEYMRPFWAERKKIGVESVKGKVINEKMKLLFPKSEYYANILVVDDKNNPENNGKVMIFKFGEQIKKELDNAECPADESESPKFPFDWENGSNLKIYATYEKTIGKNGKEFPKPTFKFTWSEPSELENAETLWEQSYSLLEFIDESKKVSYDDLKVKFCKAMNLDENFNSLEKSSANSFDDTVAEASKPKSATKPTQEEEDAPSSPPSSEEDALKALLGL